MSPQAQWPAALRIAHLKGGLRAINEPGPTVEFYPRMSDTPISYTLEEYPHLHGTLSIHFSTLIGIDFITDSIQQIGHMPAEWRPYYWQAGGDAPHDASVLWSNLAVGGHRHDNYPFVDICRRIDFQIQSASWRLHDLSEAYHRELVRVVEDKSFKDGQRFESMNSFFIYMSTHAFLSEAATLRDYLAEFVAKHVFSLSNAQNVRLMKTLRAEINRHRIAHPMAEIISGITAENGWLKELSAYRDLAIHYTPLASAERHGWIKQVVHKDKLGRAYPSIEFTLPKDPQKVKEIRSTGKTFRSAKEWLKASFADNDFESGPDALLYCHEALGNLARLAKSVGDQSPIPPEMAKYVVVGGKARLQL